MLCWLASHGLLLLLLLQLPLFLLQQGQLLLNVHHQGRPPKLNVVELLTRRTNVIKWQRRMGEAGAAGAGAPCRQLQRSCPMSLPTQCCCWLWPPGCGSRWLPPDVPRPSSTCCRSASPTACGLIPACSHSIAWLLSSHCIAGAVQAASHCAPAPPPRPGSPHPAALQQQQSCSRPPPSSSCLKAGLRLRRLLPGLLRPSRQRWGRSRPPISCDGRQAAPGAALHRSCGFLDLPLGVDGESTAQRDPTSLHTHTHIQPHIQPQPQTGSSGGAVSIMPPTIHPLSPGLPALLLEPGHGVTLSNNT